MREPSDYLFVIPKRSSEVVTDIAWQWAGFPSFIPGYLTIFYQLRPASSLACIAAERPIQQGERQNENGHMLDNGPHPLEQRRNVLKQEWLR